MPKLLSDPRILRQQIEQLMSAKKSRRLDTAGNEALAECCFRLAIHPDTSIEESLKLLKLAYKLDGTNPKYSYHLARIYFSNGDLDRAKSWIQTAFLYCPTSHRIWAHVSLLQKKLNERYYGNDKYEPDSLRKRGEEIARRVKQGSDIFDKELINFEPNVAKSGRPDSSMPEKLVEKGIKEENQLSKRRSENARTCRWSGINDLIAEDLLQRDASERNRDQILPLLKYIARVAKMRPYGISAFVIIAIEWIVFGYPIETIIRLRQIFSPRLKLPSLELLDLVCRLYQTDVKDLPKLLSESLENNKISPFLVALIHHDRLLNRSLGTNDLCKYIEAQKLLKLKGSTPETPKEHDNLLSKVREMSKNIERIIVNLEPKQKERVKDISLDENIYSIDISRLDDEVKKLGDLVHYIQCIYIDLSDFIKNYHSLSNSNSYTYLQAQIQADIDFITKKIIPEIQKNAEYISEKLDAILIKLFNWQDNDSNDAFYEKLDDCRIILNRILYSERLENDLDDIEAQLAKRDDTIAFNKLPQQSGKLDALYERIVQLSISYNNTSDQSSVNKIFNDFDEAVKTLKEYKDDAFILLKDLEKCLKQNLDSEIYSKACADAKEFDKLIAELRKTSEIGFSRLTEIDNSIVQSNNVSLVENYGQRKEDCQKLLAEISGVGNFTTILKRINSQLSKVAENFANDPTTPSEKISDIIYKIRNAFSLEQTTSASSDENKSGVSSDIDDQVSKHEYQMTEQKDDFTVLEDSIKRLDQEIEEMFETANASFDSYSIESKYLPPIQSLRMSVLARQAETFYRIGQHRKARKIWNKMLIEDRLDDGLLKNIAVCDSNGSDMGKALDSWRSYIEILYFYDIIVGNPRFNAQRRADFHRDSGNSYALKSFFEKRERSEELKIDEIELIDFVNSKARVQSYVDHKILEFLNLKFDFISPLLILGVSRAEGEKARDEAQTKMLEYIEYASQLLPERVQNAFTDVAKSYINKAHEACSSAQRLTQKNDPTYSQERTRQEAWIKDICLMKYYILTTFQASKELPKRMNSVSFIEQLLRLDKIPVDLSSEFLNVVARSLGMRENPSVYAQLMSHLQDNVLYSLLRFIFKETGDSSEDSIRDRQYNRLINDWSKEPVVSQAMISGIPYISLIDDPQGFFPSVVRDALQTNSSSQESISILKQWCQRYPRSTGPARYLAILLVRESKYDEAINILKKAINSAFYEPGRQECIKLIIQLKNNRAIELSNAGKYDEALKIFIELLNDDDSNPVLANNVINVSTQAASKNYDLSIIDNMENAINSWLVRAQARLENGIYEGQENNEEIKLTKNTIKEINQSMRQALVMMHLIPFGKLDEKTDWNSVANSMSNVISRYSDAWDAYFYRMVAWQKLAEKSNERDEVFDYLKRADSDADVVIQNSSNSEFCDQAKNLKEMIKRFF